MGDGGADQEGSRAGAPSPSRSRSAATGAGLTPKQRRFALEYLVDLNATEAAKRAGYSPRTAYAQGSRLLKHAEVAAFVAGRVQKLEEKKFLDVGRMEEELDALVNFDPATMYDAEGKLLAIKDMPERTRRALAGFDEEALFDVVQTGVGPRGGVQKERLQVGVTRKVKWHNKREAIELGFKRRGALVERVEHEVKTVSISINGISRS